MSMKTTRFLFVFLLVFGLLLSPILGLVTPVRAAEADMGDYLAKVMGVTSSDLSGYAAGYQASLPIEYERASDSLYVALGGLTAAGTQVLEDYSTGYTDQTAGKMGFDEDHYENWASEGALFSSDAVAYINNKNRAKAIKQADLITFQLDGASFIDSSMENAINEVDIVWENYITDPTLLADINNFRSKMTAEYEAEYGKKNAQSIATVLEYMLYESVVYCHETVNVIQAIRALNSDAVVLVLGLHNPMRGLSFTANGKTIDVGGMIEDMIDVCNAYLLKQTKNLAKTAFIDISAANTNGYTNVVLNINDTNAATTQLRNIANALDKQYANQAGHNYIRDQVLNSVKAPCKHTSTTTKNAKAATCKAEGYTGDTVCSDCGEVMKTGTKIAKTDHKLGALTQTKAPTCTVAGEKARICANCDYKETQSIPATGHKLNSGSVTTKPGCETTGVKTYKCTNTGCTHTKTESVPAIGHKLDSGSVTTKPGCVSAGVKTYKCTNTGCTHTKTESVPAIGHKFDNGTITKKPGCETTGVKTFKCTNTGCTHTKTESVPAIGHKFDKGTVTTQPGCETTGVKTFKCTNTGCTHTKTESVPAAGHKLDKGTVTTEPGCETTGVKTYKCTTNGCNHTKTESVPAVGHKFDKGTVTKEPGCETTGEMTLTCTVCTYTTTESIDATGHDWDNGTVTKDATCDAEGEKSFTCQSCSATKTEVISKLDHVGKLEGAVEATKNEAGYTGDTVCSLCGHVMTKGEVIPSKQEVLLDNIQNAESGSSVQIAVPNDDGTVDALIPSEVLESAKGKDVELVLDMGDYQWKIPGSKIAAAGAQALDMTVKLDLNKIPAEVVEKLAGEAPTQQLSFAHSGEFGFSADLEVALDKSHAGKTGNVYRYNENKELELVGSSQISEDGKITLSLDKADDYVIVVTENEPAPMSAIWWIVIAVTVVGCGALGFWFYKKKKCVK